VSEKVGVGDGTVGVAVAISVAVAVEVGLINVGVGVYVLVGGRIVEVDAGVDVVAYALSVAVDVSVGRVAATLGGMTIPVKKRLVAHIPMKSPIDRYLISACIITFLNATINLRRSYTRLLRVLSCESYISMGNDKLAGTGYPFE
jgi:hypothetical protein